MDTERCPFSEFGTFKEDTEGEGLDTLLVEGPTSTDCERMGVNGEERRRGGVGIGDEGPSKEKEEDDECPGIRFEEEPIGLGDEELCNGDFENTLPAEGENVEENFCVFKAAFLAKEEAVETKEVAAVLTIDVRYCREENRVERT